MLLNGENTCVLKPIFAYVSNGGGRINLEVIVNVFHPIAFVYDRCMFPRKSLHFVVKDEGRSGHLATRIHCSVTIHYQKRKICVDIVPDQTFSEKYVSERLI